MKKLSMELLATTVANKRKEKKMTMEELAEKTGMHRTSVSRLEKQEYEPSLSQLQALGEVLGFEVADLFGEDGAEKIPVTKKYKIAVAGTGYVGLSIATLLAQHHTVTAVDILPEKVEMINHKKSPIQDDYIEKYLAEKELDLTATLDGETAYKNAEFVVIAAPTNYDSKKNFFDTSAVEAVIELVLKVARRKDKLVDKLGNAYIIFIMAVPSLAYIFVFAAIGTSIGFPGKWGNAAAWGPGNIWIWMFLPMISLALPSVGGLMKWVRRYMIDQSNADYVKFARSTGMTEGEIFRKHISRNAFIYIVHGVPANILGSLTGALITERVYAVEGVGGLLTNAINQYDNGVIIAGTVFYSALSIISLILGDLLLAKYDPRVSFSNERG